MVKRFSHTSLRFCHIPNRSAPPLRGALCSDTTLDWRGGEGGGHKKQAFGNSVYKGSVNVNILLDRRKGTRESIILTQQQNSIEV
jgi:hypothetical protein